MWVRCVVPLERERERERGGGEEKKKKKKEEEAGTGREGKPFKTRKEQLRA